MNHVILEIEQEALKRGREEGWQAGIQAMVKKMLLLKIDMNDTMHEMRRENQFSNSPQVLA